MMLPVPGYLQAASIQDDALRYEWDDWRTLPALENPDEELVSRLEQLSQRASFAFECGISEWIYYRLAKLCDDPAPWDYLEAAWAMIIELRYCGYGTGRWWQSYVNETESWTGPVKGPIGQALLYLEEAFQQRALERADPGFYAGFLSPLALHIMPDPTPFNRWRERVLERLEALYPRDPQDVLGDVVPRQAVDPEFDFHVEQTEALINHFLSGLDYHKNIFLSSPDGMLESQELDQPFQGTPYVFDIETDRRARRARRTGHIHE